MKKNHVNNLDEKKCLIESINIIEDHYFNTKSTEFDTYSINGYNKLNNEKNLTNNSFENYTLNTLSLEYLGNYIDPKFINKTKDIVDKIYKNMSCKKMHKNEAYEYIVNLVQTLKYRDFNNKALINIIINLVDKININDLGDIDKSFFVNNLIDKLIINQYDNKKCLFSKYKNIVLIDNIVVEIFALLYLKIFHIILMH